MLVGADAASAHGLGGIRDLPVPGWLFFVGGATVLVVSFLALGVLWREPQLDADRGRPFPGRVQRFLLSDALRIVIGACSVAFFFLVWASAAFGTDRPSQNLAPTFIYVIFWVGMAVTVVVLGNVWSVLDPWRSVAGAVAWIARRLGVERTPRPYPAWLGVWPAALLLFSFTVLELAYYDPAGPRVLALAILVYSVATWTGMAVFGRAPWVANGDGFSVYFEFLSRLAFFGTRERDGRRELVFRQPFAKLTEMETRPGVVVFFAVMLGTVAFDGLSRSSWWVDRILDIKTSFTDPATADRVASLANLLALVVVIAFVALVYLGAIKVAERILGTDESLAGVFVVSLVPIAFVYALSHYFSLLVVQGQFVIPLLSDPYGSGRDLIGTADYEPKLDVFSPNTYWYVQIIALVVGHVIALVIAHDRAVATSPSPKVALRTQYAMLALMVLYTVGGMWLLSIG
jgi:hypothetical protein